MAKHTIIPPFRDGCHGHAAFEDTTAGSKDHWRNVAAVRLQNMNMSSARLIVFTFDPNQTDERQTLTIFFILWCFYCPVWHKICSSSSRCYVYKVLVTYPAPNCHSVWVHKAHFDEFPETHSKRSPSQSFARKNHLSCVMWVDKCHLVSSWR